MMKKTTYKDLAKYYDLIYSWKNYKKETDRIKLLIKKYKKSNGNDLLEVACGTGKHTQYFKNSFNVSATDISNDMLRIAQHNIPTVTFKQADMINLKLNKQFDVIVCLFSSISYVKNYKNLTKTLANFSAHLKKAALLLLSPGSQKHHTLWGYPQ